MTVFHSLCSDFESKVTSVLTILSDPFLGYVIFFKMRKSVI